MSEFQIEYDRAKAAGWLPYFQASAATHGFGPDLLMAIASRETNMRDIKGDFRGGVYHGYSLMQVDIGTDPAFCHAWVADQNVDQSIERGAQILAGKRDYLAQHGVTDLQDIASAYNCGEGNVIAALNENENPDDRTTGRNYGKDVMSRAAAFAAIIAGDVPDAPALSPLTTATITATTDTTGDA
jgi:soluble lytic murein transglycosylase-like protein